ncbi:MAG: 3-deoxy-7-phosphoheptulonate synthase [Bacteroidia bacterium]|jgi:3-deoxy-7-phosphoheptulonate synthase|nr:3-deoxy-7-phosphoheptulonate synthase [Bacteroidia bacterium]
MIIELKSSVQEARAQEIAQQLKAFCIHYLGRYVLITSSSVKTLDAQFEGETDRFTVLSDDMQLSSRAWQKETRTVQIGNITIGGNTGNTLLIGGPCSVESEGQIEQSAQLMKELNISTLRAGAFKPRTSPYTFQGLGLEGLKLLAKMREKYGLNIITEVRDATHIEEVIEYSDIIQIGAKSMYDHGILKRCGKTTKPVLLKRGFGTTLQEFVQCAEFILAGGNPNVMLCERGLRTFETKTRFTLDLCGAAWMKEYSNLPVILDPSHAIGYAYGVPDLARACTAMGVDGLLIEVHPNPKEAKSDASQQLNHDEFRALTGSLKAVANAIGRQII